MDREYKTCSMNSKKSFPKRKGSLMISIDIFAVMFIARTNIITDLLFDHINISIQDIAIQQISFFR